MSRLISLCCGLAAAFLLASCSNPEESVTEVANGPFKLMVRSQEYHHSGIRNVDVCLAEVSAQKFPSNKSQCFLHGFDFSGLSVGWRTQREIDVRFSTGRVTYFMNYPILTPSGANPIEFHASIHEGPDAISVGQSPLGYWWEGSDVGSCSLAKAHV
jgi:hypothetical protein